MSESNATAKFWTRVPEGAPDEIKGNRAYFRPERAEWTVTALFIHVTVHGPTTRTKAPNMASASYMVEGWREDERPDWLPLPIDALTTAKLAVEQINKEVAHND